MAAWTRLEDALAERRKLQDVVKMRHIAANKRVVGCTTSGAAKYRYAVFTLQSSDMNLCCLSYACTLCTPLLLPTLRAYTSRRDFLLLQAAAECCEFHGHDGGGSSGDPGGTRHRVTRPGLQRTIMIGDHRRPKSTATSCRYGAPADPARQTLNRLVAMGCALTFCTRSVLNYSVSSPADKVVHLAHSCTHAGQERQGLQP
jgi:hypothetical protein